MERIKPAGFHAAYASKDTHADLDLESYQKNVEEEIRALQALYQGEHRISHLKRRAASEDYEFRLTIYTTDKAARKTYIDRERDRIRALVKADIDALEKREEAKRGGKQDAGQRKTFRHKERSKALRTMQPSQTPHRSAGSMAKPPDGGNVKPGPGVTDAGKPSDRYETFSMKSAGTFGPGTPVSMDTEFTFRMPAQKHK